ncbi:MAG: hypothetical protein HY940_03775 [Gammaproteobacteria bacterium]|nr:hypothetical protein [Gammaproteobacteria bacterium]
MTNAEIINNLNSRRGEISNASQVTFFECTHRKQDGGDHQVIVEIHDHGNQVSLDARYSVFARDADDPRICVSGNDQPHIEAALAVVNWRALG